MGKKYKINRVIKKCLVIVKAWLRINTGDTLKYLRTWRLSLSLGYRDQVRWGAP